MWSRRLASVMLLCCKFNEIQASSSSTGVDDWDAKEIATFLRQNGAKTSPEQIRSLGLTTYSLFDGSLSDEVLQTKFNVRDSKKRTKVLHAVSKLGEKIRKVRER